MKNNFRKLSATLRKFWYLLPIPIFITIAFVVFGKSLNFALFGDDWFMFYVINNHYGPGNEFPYLSLKGYSQPWGVMNLCLIIIRHFFGYQSYYYFLVSIGLRVLASFVGFIFLSRFLKSKFAALIGGLFLLVGYTGIESSNYVLHMNVYLVIIFMFLSLVFLIGSYNNKFWKFILGCFFFAVALAVNPIRSHGLFPLFIIFDLVFGLTIAKENFKKELFRLTLITLSALFVYKLGFFGQVTPGIIKFDVINQMIKAGNFTFITAFITNLGKAFLPDLYNIDLTAVVYVFGANWYKWIILFAFVVELALFAVVSNFMKEKLKALFISLSSIALNFVLIGSVLRNFPRDVSLFSVLINSFIGIFLISFLVLSVYVLFMSKYEKHSPSWVGIIAGPMILLTSFAVPLLFNPGAIMGSDNRYYTLGLAGAAVTIASLLKLVIGGSKKLARPFLVLLGLLMILNIRSDRKYMTNLYPTRNVAVTEAMWNNIFEYVPKNSYPDKLLLFYFDDKDNPGLANNTILFGFPPRMAIEYKISDRGKIPTFTNIYEEVVSAVTDGKSFFRLGYPQERVGVNQIYAFRFTKGGELLDITKEIRQDLNSKIKQR